MAHNLLHRDDAPFGAKVWDAIDLAVTEAARSQLSARRIISVEGPYGLGVKSIPSADYVIEEEGDEAALVSSCITPLVLVQKGFRLSARDIAGLEQTGMPFSLAEPAQAAIACARREDELLFNGCKALGLTGLLNAKGVQSMELSDWEEAGIAAGDLIKAATLLDEAGFHGPYALALAPACYNLLFRRYEQSSMVEIEHVRTLITDGVAKAPAIDSGGVLIATGRQFATIVLGQDLMTAFVGPDDGCYQFNIAESVALRLQQPKAVCVLK